MRQIECLISLSRALLLLFLLVGRVFSIRRAAVFGIVLSSGCVVAFVVLDPEVVHDDYEFAEEYSVFEVGLGEHSHEARDFYLFEVGDT